MLDVSLCRLFFFLLMWAGETFIMVKGARVDQQIKSILTENVFHLFNFLLLSPLLLNQQTVVLLGHSWSTLSTLGPFITFIVPNFVLQTLYPPLTNISSRACEKEADLLSLGILARAGYDPISAARVQKFFVESKEKPLLTKFTRCTTLAQKKALFEGMDVKRKDNGKEGRRNGKGKKQEMDPVERQDKLLKQYGERKWWKDTHPEGRERLEYLLKAMYPARQAFWENEKVRKVLVRRFKYRPSAPVLALKSLVK